MRTPGETSLKDKVRAISKAQGKPLNVVWRQLVLERFLFRISASAFREKFIFKGGMLLSHYIPLGRETADLDFLLRGLGADKNAVKEAIEEICLTPACDGFEFSVARLEVVDHLLTKYSGFELTLDAQCGTSRNKISIDIGVGEWAEVVSKEISLISNSKGPIFESDISLMVYPVEMIFAEKLQTACFRGAKNSRMKDYHDLFVLCRSAEKLNLKKVNLYCVRVFSDRKTPLSIVPQFEGQELRTLEALWNRHRGALVMDVQGELPKDFSSVVGAINSWLERNITSLQ